jgi:hypothetical protein
MKKISQAGLIISMIILGAKAFGQNKEPESNKIYEGKKTAESHLDLMVNVVSRTV